MKMLLQICSLVLCGAALNGSALERNVTIEQIARDVYAFHNPDDKASLEVETKIWPRTYLSLRICKDSFRSPSVELTDNEIKPNYGPISVLVNGGRPENPDCPNYRYKAPIKFVTVWPDMVRIFADDEHPTPNDPEATLNDALNTLKKKDVKDPVIIVDLAAWLAIAYTAEERQTLPTHYIPKQVAWFEPTIHEYQGKLATREEFEEYQQEQIELADQEDVGSGCKLL